MHLASAGPQHAQEHLAVEEWLIIVACEALLARSLIQGISPRSELQSDMRQEERGVRPHESTCCQSCFRVLEVGW